MLPLHPTSQAYSTGRLPPEEGHSIYFEECGTPSGTPVLYLHGGPGSGFSREITRLLDPQRYRIILMDQRGAGHSTPHGSLEHNTTPHLIADMERLRTHLGIDRWMLFGGSWGATLSVAYAMAHPAHVTAMVLYGLFLARQSELAALYFKGGVAAALYPDIFETFISALAPDQQADPIAGYASLFTHSDAAVRHDALYRWTALEKAVSRFEGSTADLADDMSNADYVLAHSLIENHYFQCHGFIDADDILARGAGVLADIPIDLIAARYDMVCPIKTAHDFARAVPHTRLTIVPDAGHTWRDPSNTQALLACLNAHASKG